MATNLLRVGNELQVNQLPNVPNNQSAPDIAAMGNGNFFVGFQDDGGDHGNDIVGQFVNADGGRGAQSSGNDAPSTATGDQVEAAVAARADGGLIVVWRDDSTFDVRFTLLGADGKNTIRLGDLGASLSVNGNTPLEHPDVATFTDGVSMIVWERTFSLNDTDIAARTVSAAGLLSSDAFPLSIDGSGPGFSRAPAIAASGNKALIAYGDIRNDNNPATTDNFDIRILVVDHAAGNVGIGSNGGKPIANMTTSDLGNVDVSALSDGRYIVVYEDTTNGDVYGRIVSATGTPVGAEIVIAKTSADEGLPKVAALADGGFVVVWDQTANGVEDVMARRFLSDGTPGGDRFRVNAELGSSFGSSIAANKDGKVFISFTTFASHPTDDDGLSVRGGLFQVTNQPVNGSANPDTLTTYNLAEKISGLAGDDKIDARGGSDTIDGNEGADTMTGGLGSDTFVFSAKLKAANADHITDFAAGADRIALDVSVFKKLGTGDLSKKALFAHKNADDAKDSKDRIVYDTKSGELYFDKDGAGGKHAKLFATLDTRPDIDHTDFVLVA